jgi:hypothetical protein
MGVRKGGAPSEHDEKTQTALGAAGHPEGSEPNIERHKKHRAA